MLSAARAIGPCNITQHHVKTSIQRHSTVYKYPTSDIKSACTWFNYCYLKIYLEFYIWIKHKVQFYRYCAGITLYMALLWIGLQCTFGTRCGQVSGGVGHTVVPRLARLTDLLVSQVVVGSRRTSDGVRSSQGTVVGLRTTSYDITHHHLNLNNKWEPSWYQGYTSWYQEYNLKHKLNYSI